MGKIDVRYAEWYMRQLYNEIYGSEFWRYVNQTKSEPHTLYRHVIRYFIREDTKLTLKEIAQVEATLLNKDPANHATIKHSIDYVKDKLIDQKLFVECQDARAIVRKMYKPLAKQLRIRDTKAVFFTAPLKQQFEWLTEFLDNNPEIRDLFVEFINSKNNE